MSMIWVVSYFEIQPLKAARRPSICATLVYLLGRWVAIWRVADAKDDDPEADRWDVVTITTDDSSPYGLQFLLG